MPKSGLLSIWESVHFYYLEHQDEVAGVSENGKPQRSFPKAP